MAFRLNSIGNKVQLVFIPGLLAVAFIIASIMLGQISRLYNTGYEARLSGEMSSVRYVFDVFQKNVEDAAWRTAEFRDVTELFKAEDWGGVAQALKSRIDTEQLDYAFTLRKAEGGFEVVGRGPPW